MSATYTGSATSPSTKPLYRGVQIVWYIFGIIQTLLVFRLFFKLVDANSGAGFTSFIYGLSSPFVAPFISVFPATEFQGGVFEWSTILAMVVYWILALGIIRIFFMAKTVSTPEAAEKLEKEEV